MSDYKKWGDLGEDLASEFLERKGLRILKRNYRNSIGEIDIVAMDKGTLVIVEVKARRNRNYGYPREAVHASKQKNIILVTESFLSEHNLWSLPVRFDVVEVYLDEGRIVHIPEAFICE